MIKSRKEFEYTLRACRKSKENHQKGTVAKTLQERSPKNPGAVSEKAEIMVAVEGATGNGAVTER